jgi:hypothetical protein
VSVFILTMRFGMVPRATRIREAPESNLHKHAVEFNCANGYF